MADRFVSFSKEDEAVSAKDAMDWKVTMALIVNNFIAGFFRSSIEDKLCSEGVRGGPVGVPRLPNGGDGASNGNAWTSPNLSSITRGEDQN